MSLDLQSRKKTITWLVTSEVTQESHVPKITIKVEHQYFLLEDKSVKPLEVDLLVLLKHYLTMKIPLEVVAMLTEVTDLSHLEALLTILLKNTL
jgi:hypothetical protein